MVTEELGKATYKQLQQQAKDRGVTYAKRRPDGTVQWASKHTLRQRLGNELCDCSQCTAFAGSGGAVTTPEEVPETAGAPLVTSPVAPVAAGDLFTQLIQSAIAGQVEALRKEVKQIAASATTGAPPVIEIKTPTVTRDVEGHTHEVFPEVLRLASQRLPILLVGPAGCGKTHLASQVADALNLPFAFLSCSIGMSEAQLLGWLLPLGDNGRFAYQESAFVKAYEQGGVFLLDEIDAADANLLTVLNASLANGHLAVPQRIQAPVAKKHADFVLIAAANTYGHGSDRMYVGRNQLDMATLDRFAMGTVSMDYDAEIEKKTINHGLLSWAKGLRPKITQQKIRRVLSTRFLRDASQMLAAYPEAYSLQTIQDKYFQSWTADERAKV